MLDFTKICLFCNRAGCLECYYSALCALRAWSYSDGARRIVRGDSRVLEVRLLGRWGDFWEWRFCTAQSRGAFRLVTFLDFAWRG